MSGGLAEIYHRKCQACGLRPNPLLEMRLRSSEVATGACINLSNIPTDSTFDVLLECVALVPNIDTVDFSNSKMTDEHVETVCHQMHRIGSVRHVSFRDNPLITDRTARALLALPDHLRSMVSVDCEGTSLSEVVLGQLLRALRTNESLRRPRGGGDLATLRSVSVSPEHRETLLALNRTTEQPLSVLPPSSQKRVLLRSLRIAEHWMTILTWENPSRTFFFIVPILASILVTRSVVTSFLGLIVFGMVFVHSDDEILPHAEDTELQAPLRRIVSLRRLVEANHDGIVLNAVFDLIDWQLERGSAEWLLPLSAAMLVSLILPANLAFTLGLVTLFAYYPVLRPQWQGREDAIRLLRERIANQIAPSRQSTDNRVTNEPRATPLSTTASVESPWNRGGLELYAASKPQLSLSSGQGPPDCVSLSILGIECVGIDAQRLFVSVVTAENKTWRTTSVGPPFRWLEPESREVQKGTLSFHVNDATTDGPIFVGRIDATDTFPHLNETIRLRLHKLRQAIDIPVPGSPASSYVDQASSYVDQLVKRVDAFEAQQRAQWLSLPGTVTVARPKKSCFLHVRFVASRQTMMDSGTPQLMTPRSSLGNNDHADVESIDRTFASPSGASTLTTR